MAYRNIEKDLKELANPNKINILSSFFKTGPGEYGEGDVFIGITVPNQRKIAKKYQTLAKTEIIKLLHSPIHEHRLTALIILVNQFEKGDTAEQEKIYKLYLKNTEYINNWDLVDTTTPKIVGAYLLNHQLDSRLRGNDKMGEKEILYKLVKSKSLWERRIAVLATFAFIKNNDFKDILKMSKLLLEDKHDLIHKSVGWMLREVGKRDISELKNFLNIHSKIMPRTMLRYSIEKLDKSERKKYMTK